MIGDVFRPAQGGDCTLEVSGVPQDDGGDEEVETGGTMLLVLVGPVAYSKSAKRPGRRCGSGLSAPEASIGNPLSQPTDPTSGRVGR